MTDTLSQEMRSWNMSRIRDRDTKPELAVRSLIHRMGYRFRLHVSTLPGRPDIVLPRHRKIIFVHGCFWHRHEGCQYAYEPKSRPEFWQKKFRENVQRDRKVLEQLEGMGWRILTVWECELRYPDTLVERIDKFLMY